MDRKTEKAGYKIRRGWVEIRKGLVENGKRWI